MKHCLILYAPRISRAKRQNKQAIKLCCLQSLRAAIIYFKPSSNCSHRTKLTMKWTDKDAALSMTATHNSDIKINARMVEIRCNSLLAVYFFFSSFKSTDHVVIINGISISKRQWRFIANACNYIKWGKQLSTFLNWMWTNRADILCVFGLSLL